MLHGSIEGFAGRRSSGSGRYGPRSNCGLDCTWDAGHFGFSGWFDLCLHAGIEEVAARTVKTATPITVFCFEYISTPLQEASRQRSSSLLSVGSIIEGWTLICPESTLQFVNSVIR